MLQLHRSVDRLGVAVSRALAEPRVAQLRGEYERLRLIIFFRTWGSERFKRALIHANEALTRCTCLRCQEHDRQPTGYFLNDEETAPCLFLPWLHGQFREHGLQVALCDVPDPDERKVWTPFSHYIETYDTAPSAHLFAEGAYFAFGRKIWGARTADDPELRKLTRFIDCMESIANDDAGTSDTSHRDDSGSSSSDE